MACGLHAVGMLLFDSGCLEPEGAGRGAGRNYSPQAGWREEG